MMPRPKASQHPSATPSLYLRSPFSPRSGGDLRRRTDVVALPAHALAPECFRLGAAGGEGHRSAHGPAVAAKKQALLVEVVDDAGYGVWVVGVEVAKDDTARLGGP